MAAKTMKIRVGLVLTVNAKQWDANYSTGTSLNEIRADVRSYVENEYSAHHLTEAGTIVSVVQTRRTRPSKSGEATKKIVDVPVGLVIEVDPESWGNTYSCGTTRDEIEADVRSYVTNGYYAHHLTAEGTILSVTETHR